MTTTSHPDRAELLKALQGPTPSVAEHLKGCSVCRELFDLLAAYPVAGELMLTSAPPAWIERAASIMSSGHIATTIRTLLARVAFDSWAVPSAVGVRSVAGGTERRLRFEAESLVFDLRAEKSAAGWDFVAQVVSDRTPAPIMQLRAGRTVIPTTPNGLYHWSSKRPPAKLALYVDGTLIELPEVPWKSKRPH
jgi:hypothetical protein